MNCDIVDIGHSQLDTASDSVFSMNYHTNISYCSLNLVTQVVLEISFGSLHLFFKLQVKHYIYYPY